MVLCYFADLGGKTSYEFVRCALPSSSLPFAWRFDRVTCESRPRKGFLEGNFMHAVEFQSTIRNDGSIVAPSKAKSNAASPLRFSSSRIKTKGFKFDRERANER